MKIITPSATEITETDILKKIEYIGRTCYKSEDKITGTSAANFVRNLVKSNHLAMLEHAKITVWLPLDTLICDLENGIMPNKFWQISVIPSAINSSEQKLVITANLRSIIEYNDGYVAKDLRRWLTILHPEVAEICGISYEDSEFSIEPAGGVIENISTLPLGIRDKHSYRTFKFVTDRGVTHELVRHRDASFAQESTRYAAYDKDKFGSEITFVKPADYQVNWTNEAKSIFERNCMNCELNYMEGRQQAMQAQQARAFLPNSTKTEIVVTASEEEWHHIGDLRYRGTTGKPHPDMKALMDELVKIYPDL